MSTLDQIRRNNQKFGELFATGDAKAVAGLYTAEARMFPPGAQPINGIEAIRTFWSDAMEMGITGVRIETSEVEDLGDTAIDTGTYTLSLRDGSVADRGKYVVVWKRHGGEWKLHRDIWNTSVPTTKTAGV